MKDPVVLEPHDYGANEEHDEAVENAGMAQPGPGNAANPLLDDDVPQHA